MKIFFSPTDAQVTCLEI